MGLGDRLVGLVLLLVGVAVFAYYSLWVLGAPFLPAASPLLAAFPPRELALVVPAALLVAVLTFAGALAGWVMYAEGAKRAAARARAAREAAAAPAAPAGAPAGRTTKGGKGR